MAECSREDFDALIARRRQEAELDTTAEEAVCFEVGVDPTDWTERALDLMDRTEDLEALVRWLAIPYDGATPIFASEGISGEPLYAARQLHDIWESVMGQTGPPAPGRLVRCASCGHISVEAVAGRLPGVGWVEAIQEARKGRF